MLGLAAKIRIQSDGIQDCHNKWVLEVEKEMNKILKALDDDWFSGLASVLHARERRQNIKKRIVALRQQIEYIVEYVRINVVAFRKITKKIDKRLGTCLSQPIMSRIARKRYFLVGFMMHVCVYARLVVGFAYNVSVRVSIFLHVLEAAFTCLLHLNRCICV